MKQKLIIYNISVNKQILSQKHTINLQKEDLTAPVYGTVENYSRFISKIHKGTVATAFITSVFVVILGKLDCFGVCILAVHRFGECSLYSVLEISYIATQHQVSLAKGLGKAVSKKTSKKSNKPKRDEQICFNLDYRICFQMYSLS